MEDRTKDPLPLNWPLIAATGIGLPYAGIVCYSYTPEASRIPATMNDFILTALAVLAVYGIMLAMTRRIERGLRQLVAEIRRDRALAEINNDVDIGPTHTGGNRLHGV